MIELLLSCHASILQTSSPPSFHPPSNNTQAQPPGGATGAYSSGGGGGFYGSSEVTSHDLNSRRLSSSFPDSSQFKGGGKAAPSSRSLSNSGTNRSLAEVGCI